MSTVFPQEPPVRSLKMQTMPSTKASKPGSGEVLSSDNTEKSLTPQNLPKAGTYHASTTTEVPKRETFLARSFRKLSSVLRLSIISRSFKSKSYLAEMRGKLGAGWSDIVDHVIDSDNDSESFDSYVEFMHGHMRAKKGRSKSLRRKLWSIRTRDKEILKDENNGGNDSETEQFVPWFEESC